MNPGVINIYKILLWCQVFCQEFLSRPKYAIRGTGILGRILLGSSAAFGGGLQRPSPFRVRSAHRRERGRMPSEKSEKLQKYRMSRSDFGDFGCIFRLCLQRLDDLQNWHHFQTVLDSVWNFAVAYSRALVSLLHFFTSSFGFSPAFFVPLFVLVLPARNSFF